MQLEKPILEFDVPDYVHSFVDSHLSGDALRTVLSLMSGIKSHLQAKHLRNTERLDLFADYEYSDWKELRIIVSVDSSPLADRSKLKSEIYDLAEKKLSEDLLTKVIISFEFL